MTSDCRYEIDSEQEAFEQKSVNQLQEINFLLSKNIGYLR